MARKDAKTGAGLLAPAFLVMLATLALPLTALVVMSFWSQDGFTIDRTFTLENYARILTPSDEPTYWYGIPFPFEYPVPAILIVKSLAMSLVATISVILLAWPMAYFLAFRVGGGKVVWLILLTIPFWTSYLLRVFSWKVMLGFNGAVNTGLQSLGIIEEPLEFLLYNPVAVTITLAHSWIAFAVLPIYVSMDKIDRDLLSAAADLGDTRWQRLKRITIPLSMPGTVAATLLVFIPTVGDYVTPTLVGGPGGTMIGSLVQQLFTRQDNAPMGAAVSIVMMIVIALVALLFLWAVGYGRMRRRLS